MVSKLCTVFIVFGILLCQAVSANSIESELAELKSKIAELETLKTRVAELEQQVKQARETPAPAPVVAQEEPSLDALLAGMREEQTSLEPSAAPRSFDLHSGLQSFNPDISLIFSGLYHGDNRRGGIGSILEEVDGFNTRDVGAFDKGFQIQEIELFLSAQIDPFFFGYANFVFDEDGAELEEAVVRTTSLPWGMEVKGGKFFSDFSRANWMHPHDWDFADRPLTSNLFFGEDGLNQTGVQISWLAPTDFKLLLGAEFLQGNNEDMFNHIGGDGLKDRSGPRLMVQWAKYSPDLPNNHDAQIGVFHGYGRHQDEWNDTGLTDGYSRFLGTDFVYKYDAPYALGYKNFTLQGEYIYRHRDTDLDVYDADPTLIGNSRVDKQDGYYMQGIYGFAPQWRTGLRWEQVGLLNRSRFPDGTRDNYGDSRRLSAMVDYTPSDFSRFRLQLSRGEYQVDSSREEVYQAMFQVIFSLGVHGAHKF